MEGVQAGLPYLATGISSVIHPVRSLCTFLYKLFMLFIDAGEPTLSNHALQLPVF
jgi:hypothetical protein